jgi:hypothetical protein
MNGHGVFGIGSGQALPPMRLPLDSLSHGAGDHTEPTSLKSPSFCVRATPARAAMPAVVVVEVRDVLVDVRAHHRDLRAAAGPLLPVVARVGVRARVVALGAGQLGVPAEPRRVVVVVGVGRLEARHEVHAQDRSAEVVVVELLPPLLLRVGAGDARAEAVDGLRAAVRIDRDRLRRGVRSGRAQADRGRERRQDDASSMVHGVHPMPPRAPARRLTRCAMRRVARIS